MTAALHPTHSLPTDQEAFEEMDTNRDIAEDGSKNTLGREAYDTYVQEKTAADIAECVGSTPPEDTEVETNHD